MGYLARLVDPPTGSVLWQFEPLMPETDFGWERRSGTYAVRGADGGVDPDGNNLMPLAAGRTRHKFRRVFNRRAGESFDSFHDSLNAALAVPHKLVYLADTGKYRETAVKPLSHVVTLTHETWLWADFEVTWERVYPYWQSTVPGNVLLWDVGGRVWDTNTPTWDANAIGLPLATNLINCSTAATAVADAATVPDYTAVITVTGPFGGTLGMNVQNWGPNLVTTAGASARTIFAIADPAGLPDNTWSYAIDMGAQTAYKFHLGAITDIYSLLVVPSAQREWFRIDPPNPLTNPGGVNNVYVSNIGTSTYTGGLVQIDYRNKYL